MSYLDELEILVRAKFAKIGTYAIILAITSFDTRCPVVTIYANIPALSISKYLGS